MLKTVFYAAILFGLSYPGFSAVREKEEPYQNNFNIPIRVLLDRDARVVRLRSALKGIYFKSASNDWQETSNSLEVRWKSANGNPVLVSSALKKPVSTVFLRGGPYPADKLQYKTVFFRGAIRLTATSKGMLVTNLLTLDDYLRGMLAHEMSPSWEIEALKAQAVASRTYALYMMAHPKSAFYDLESTTQDQVYGGANGEDERVRLAVLSTHNQVLTLNHSPIKSYFHSRCGGTTETAQTVWNENRGEHKTRVACPYCRKFPATWKASIPWSELFASLKLPSPRVAYAASSLLPAQKTPSGRTTKFLLSNGTSAFKISGDRLRSAIGYEKLKSTVLKWKAGKDEIQFEGVGNGHGVGMCQWGARYLARQGKTYREILSYYYPGTSLQASP